MPKKAAKAMLLLLQYQRTKARYITETHLVHNKERKRDPCTKSSRVVAGVHCARVSICTNYFLPGEFGGTCRAVNVSKVGSPGSSLFSFFVRPRHPGQQSSHSNAVARGVGR